MLFDKRHVSKTKLISIPESTTLKRFDFDFTIVCASKPVPNHESAND